MELGRTEKDEIADDGAKSMYLERQKAEWQEHGDGNGVKGGEEYASVV